MYELSIYKLNLLLAYKFNFRIIHMPQIIWFYLLSQKLSILYNKSSPLEIPSYVKISLATANCNYV